ncbi:MAG TPA: glycosyltransferase family 4 protein [Anaerolineales bacterium]|nr:glycosyltransferase family 4 protein [Anaerolineales bacterium]
MKITFLQSSLWLSGGARAHIEFGNRLAQRGHRTAIVIPRGAIDPEMAAAVGPGLEIIQAGYPLHKPAVRRTTNLDRIRLALAMFRAVPPGDILIATHTPTTLVSLMAGRFRNGGLPVWFYMDYPGMFAGRRAEGWLLRNAMRWHAGAMVISRHSAEELRLFAGGDVRFVGLALNDYEVFTAARRVNVVRDGGEKRVMYLGDFRPRKGLADFLAAAERVHKLRGGIRLVLVLKEAGELETPVPHDVVMRPDTPALAELYAGSDLFVSSSWHEGFGLPPLEAMACGAPVVLTDSGGVRDFARDGENCLVVPPKSTDALAEAMRRVLDEPGLAERFRTAGPPTAAEFTWEKAVDRLEEALVEFKSKKG